MRQSAGRRWQATPFLLPGGCCTLHSGRPSGFQETPSTPSQQLGRGLAREAGLRFQPVDGKQGSSSSRIWDQPRTSPNCTGEKGRRGEFTQAHFKSLPSQAGTYHPGRTLGSPRDGPGQIQPYGWEQAGWPQVGLPNQAPRLHQAPPAVPSCRWRRHARGAASKPHLKAHCSFLRPKVVGTG